VIIAVDGPAASGKGTLARRLAEHLGLVHLDTGRLYRAVALAVMRENGNPENQEDALKAAQTLDNLDLSDPELRTEAVGNAASLVARHQSVRKTLLDYQREVAARGAVLDGRDIGTVVCPDADHKLFVTASLEARAARRHAELVARGNRVSLAEIKAEMAERDRQDQERSISPLRPAPDAHLLDTTNLDIDSAFSTALALVS